MGIIDFLKDFEELLQDRNYEQIQHEISTILNAYIENIPQHFDDIIKYYSKKSKDDKSWFPLNGIITPEKKISFSDYRKKKYLLQIELNKLQMWLKLNDKKLLILIEGRDGAGKTAIIKSISENMDSTKCRVEKFDIPTEEESKDWFKRYEQKVPKKGEVVIYDRSWYNRAVIEPVMGYCTEDQYKDFYKDIEKFEKKLTDDGVIILKFWYSIDFETQKMRFEFRKTNPLKYWKFTKNDKETLTKFDTFTDYIRSMFEKTNFPFAPWRVIDSNDRKMAKITTMQHILERFEYEDKNLDFIYDQDF